MKTFRITVKDRSPGPDRVVYQGSVLSDAMSTFNEAVTDCEYPSVRMTEFDDVNYPKWVSVRTYSAKNNL